jgi:hypothetical protein
VACRVRVHASALRPEHGVPPRLTSIPHRIPLPCSTNQKASETMSKKTGPLAHPSSTNPASEQKPAAVSVSGHPAPNGKAVSEEVVRLRAYQKWEAAGKPGGDDVRFWLEAEQELLQAR